MSITIFFRALHRDDYGLASFGEIAKGLGYELNRKFMLHQWYAPLMAALVEKAPYLGDRLVATSAVGGGITRRRERP